MVYLHLLEKRQTMYYQSNYVPNSEANGQICHKPEHQAQQQAQRQFPHHVQLMVAHTKRGQMWVEKSVCFKYFALGRSIKTFCPVIRKHFLLNMSPSLLGSWRKTQHFIKRQPSDVLSEMSTRLFLTQQGATWGPLRDPEHYGLSVVQRASKCTVIMYIQGTRVFLANSEMHINELLVSSYGQSSFPRHLRLINSSVVLFMCNVYSDIKRVSPQGSVSKQQKFICIQVSKWWDIYKISAMVAINNCFYKRFCDP